MRAMSHHEGHHEHHEHEHHEGQVFTLALCFALLIRRLTVE